MFLQFLPWRFLIKRAAHAYGVIDPATVLARIRRFSQPSEVQEPIELLRAGIIFQARGLINTRAIQYNLDWVWPNWVERQFNPSDLSFIPRAFSATHVNLTQRNWSAVGQPNLPLYPLIDPRGLFTPLYNGWSIDFWIIPSCGEDPLLPSKEKSVLQRYVFDPNLSVLTRLERPGLRLETSADLSLENGGPEARVQIKGLADRKGWLCVSLRPYNPEGIQFIEKISYDSSGPCFRVDDRTKVYFDRPPDRLAFSNYEEGDVFNRLEETVHEDKVTCHVGLATSAALFALEPGREGRTEIRIPLAEELKREFPHADSAAVSWRSALRDSARLEIPDKKIQYLFDCAVRTLVLLSPHDIFPGPFGYRRFWFRDACMMLSALMALGLLERSKRILDKFPGRQKRNGFFLSQEGEWDSNGQVLWIMDRFQSLTGQDLPEGWLKSILKGANWLIGKRMRNQDRERLEGLLPAGFSAEHLGPNDYYYWDDFWGTAGLRAAGRLAGLAGLEDERRKFEAEADDFLKAIFRSIEAIPENKFKGAIPAAPYRRMDAGAVGSMVADWPLKLTAPNDQRVARTLSFLMEHCFHRRGFFQDMIHSGINIYLTLGLAQTLLRFGDDRYQTLITASVGLASPTGQWPEAIHPFSGGGCMGDGQHGWAAAEWVWMIRNMFVREEDGLLMIGSGIFPGWIEPGVPISFGPTPTPYGPIAVFLKPEGEELEVHVKAKWREKPPRMETLVRGYENRPLPEHSDRITLKRIAQ